ncbi:MAG: hypothetical protein H7318_15645 [Oligoflexus sp.]|nr:hypothetical protein [Oligoflexus sp.]
MKSPSLRNALTIPLAFFLILGTSCTTPKTETTSESQPSEHEGHHPAASATQKLSDSSDMKGNGGMMDKMKMKQMMEQCMNNHKDNKSCDHQMMDKCTKNMDSQECMKMMSDAKKEGN